MKYYTDRAVIVAMSENKVIGVNGKIPWRLKGDMEHFRKTTLGRTVVMGRNTYDSIGKPLPKRNNIVITSRYLEADVGIAASFEGAQWLAERSCLPTLYIGGRSVYEAALCPDAQLVNYMYITRVHTIVEYTGEDNVVTYPDDEVDYSQWKITDSLFYRANDDNEYDFTIETYEIAW